MSGGLSGILFSMKLQSPSGQKAQNCMLGDILEASGPAGPGLTLTGTVFFTGLLATLPTPLNMIYLSVIH